MPRTPAPPPPAARLQRNALVFWPILAVTVTADVVTKHLAEARLPLHVPRDVLGEWIRLTLTYNTGAAMSLSAGAASRVVFTIVASLMLVVIFRMYRRIAQHDAAQSAALALIAAGALGNLIDRLRSARGVVDFIDVGAGGVRFWTFNVADMGVTVGAVLLALVLLRQPATRE